jgi:hyperosmotically inducible protein
VSTLLITSSPLRAADTDSRIESSAAKSYTFKTYLKDDSIKTDSKNGVVTLTGTVADASHKSMAENTVASLPGVTSVDNQLLINGEQPAEHSDAWITTKVKTALLFHRNVSGHRNHRLYERRRRHLAGCGEQHGAKGTHHRICQGR